MNYEYDPRFQALCKPPGEPICSSTWFDAIKTKGDDSYPRAIKRGDLGMVECRACRRTTPRNGRNAICCDCETERDALSLRRRIRRIEKIWPAPDVLWMALMLPSDPPWRFLRKLWWSQHRPSAGVVATESEQISEPDRTDDLRLIRNMLSAGYRESQIAAALTETWQPYIGPSPYGQRRVFQRIRILQRGQAGRNVSREAFRPLTETDVGLRREIAYARRYGIPIRSARRFTTPNPYRPDPVVEDGRSVVQLFVSPQRRACRRGPYWVEPVERAELFNLEGGATLVGWRVTYGWPEDERPVELGQFPSRDAALRACKRHRRTIARRRS